MSSNSENLKRQESVLRRTLIEQLQRLGEIASTETALFHQAAATQYGLGITDMKTLSILIQEGPMTAGDIGNRLGLTSGSVTTLVDRLEREGLVMRQPHPKDRRKVIVAANPERLARENNVYDSMGEAFARLLQSYSTEQLKFLVQFYLASIEVTKQEIAKLTRK